MDKRCSNIVFWIVMSLSLVWAGVLFVAGVGWARGTIQVPTPNPWYNWQEFTMPAVLLMYLPSTLLGWKQPNVASWLLFAGAGLTVIQALGSNRYNGDSMVAWFYAATIIVGLPMLLTGFLLRWRSQIASPGMSAI